MRFLSFLSSSDGILLQFWPGRLMIVSPVMTGVLAAAFWTIVAARWRRAGPPGRPYTLLTIYAVAATLMNIYLVRFHGARLSPPVLYATGLFAGSSLAIHIAAPVLRSLQSPHAIPKPAGAGIAIGIPMLLMPLPYFAYSPPCALFLLASCALGLWSLLFLINVGFFSMMTTRVEPMLLSGVFFVVPEYLGLALAPEFIRQIAPHLPT